MFRSKAYEMSQKLNIQKALLLRAFPNKVSPEEVARQAWESTLGCPGAS